MTDNSQNNLVILRGEFGALQGSDAKISSPNAKDGVVLALSDSENKVVVLAHFDSSKNLEENLGAIFSSAIALGANIQNLRCNLMGREINPELEKSLGIRGVKVDKETWSGTHPYNVTASSNGEIAVNNSADEMRKMLNAVLFTKDGEKRLGDAMSAQANDFLQRVGAPQQATMPRSSAIQLSQTQQAARTA